jgi:hypothetical protein
MLRAFIFDPFGDRLEFIQAAHLQAPRTKDAQ